MEHPRLVTCLLSEVASARATIAASYARLWRADPGPPADPDDRESRPGLPPDAGAKSQRDQRPSRDVG
jgi:hypothetical protein